MFISNINSVRTAPYKCGLIVGNYLIKKGLPVLSREDNIMVFSNTDELQKAINEMPIYIKLLVKVGVING